MSPFLSDLLHFYFTHTHLLFHPHTPFISPTHTFYFTHTHLLFHPHTPFFFLQTNTANIFLLYACFIRFVLYKNRFDVLMKTILFQKINSIVNTLGYTNSLRPVKRRKISRQKESASVASVYFLLQQDGRQSNLFRYEETRGIKKIFICKNYGNGVGKQKAHNYAQVTEPTSKF